MYYSDLVLKACSILFEAHREDVDLGGYPYVFHPYHLASQMEDEETVCAALLHDVMEDHSDRYSLEDLRRAGFPEAVLTALRLLTHRDGVPYMEYVEKIAENPIAKKVKIADLEHNLDTRRTGGRKPRKYDTYLEALQYLKRS